MKISSKIIIDILVAVAISLVVNFSHLLLIFIDQTPQSTASEKELVPLEGRLFMSADGHGYLCYNQIDSAYVSRGRVERYALQDGDTISTLSQRAPNGSPRHSEVRVILSRNGRVVVPYGSIYSPSRIVDFAIQLIYYFVLSLMVIVVATTSGVRDDRRRVLGRMFLALLLAMVLYLVAPLIRHRGEFIFNLMLRQRSIIDFMITLKWSFAVIVSMLYIQIYTLVVQRQNIMLENERLLSESINAQYNMLMSQINPHVFFNSLNSLSMLVRERDEQRSLKYIDQLSYTFRYILQNRESTLTTLSEELRFIDAYIYLFKIRYAEKLIFDIDIDPRYDSYRIPALSLQPLLDNAVKHNTIVSSRPFHVTIRVENGVMVVSNDRYPKLDAEPSTGVGLENLRRRWLLIANEPIEVIQLEESFTVKLPLMPPVL